MRELQGWCFVKKRLVKSIQLETLTTMLNEVGLEQGECRQRPSVAFVILTWNSDRYITECVNSILAFEKIDVTVYVIDNGSTDRTVELITSFDDERVHLCCLQTNHGTTYSRNLALLSDALTDGYISVLDSDTVVNEKAYCSMIDVLKSDDRIGLVGPIMRDSSGQVQMSGRNLPSLAIKTFKAIPLNWAQRRAEVMEQPTSITHGGVQEVPYLLSACWLMRSSLVASVGPLDERIFYAPEDVDYCIRVWKSGFKVVLCHDASIIHEYQRISKQKILSKTNFEHIKGLIYLFRKHRFLLDSEGFFASIRGTDIEK